MTEDDDGRQPARRTFAEWFWRPSWDANLPDDPQARYFARKEHARLTRRRILYVVVGIIVLVIVINALKG